MKYITIKVPNMQEQIFVFDDSIVHSDFLETVRMIPTYGFHMARERGYALAKCVGAGFVYKGVCQGHSESLGIASRGQVDTALLGMLP